MRIGFDLDKVLIGYPPIIPGIIIDTFYKEKDNGVLLYRIPGKIEQKLRLLIHVPPLRQPIKKNLAFVRDLAKQKKYTIFLVSGRFGFLEKTTNRLMKRLKFSEIFHLTYFNFDNQQPHIFKSAIIKKEKIERFIDDDLSLLKHLAKDNPQARFFWLNNFIEKDLSKNLRGITDIRDSLK